MQTVKSGDTVRVHYTGKLDDGTVFDTSDGREPLEFTTGRRQVVTGFEKAVLEMSVGQKKTVRVSSEEAYGPRNEDFVIKVEPAKFPPHIKPEVGLHLQLTQPDGTILNVLVAGIAADVITLDANHPFAGKDLTFEMELAEIVASGA